VPDDGYFDERVAARYDDSLREMLGSDAVDPAVEFLSSWPGPVGRSSSESAQGG
jgi:hypothetical protein